MRLTTDDRLDITELPARYADALDRLQPQRLREVFTTDVVWEMIAGSPCVVVCVRSDPYPYPGSACRGPCMPRGAFGSERETKAGSPGVAVCGRCGRYPGLWASSGFGVSAKSAIAGQLPPGVCQSRAGRGVARRRLWP